MKFRISTEMTYEVRSAGTLLLNIHALSTPTQNVLEETFEVDPAINIEEIHSGNGENRIVRLELGEPGIFQINYHALVDNHFQIKNYNALEETVVGKMDPSILPFLYPSRYCQSDKLFRLANNLFGHIISPYEKVVTLSNWINENVEYQSGTTDNHTSAFDTVTEQTGVCRDFAHLGIALCRALTIPARYFTGYAYQLVPADFHACFEAYIGDEWILFDATRLAPLNGMIKIASGQDASDTAIANIFGDILFTAMQVNCELEDEGFEPYYRWF